MTCAATTLSAFLFRLPWRVLLLTSLLISGSFAQKDSVAPKELLAAGRVDDAIAILRQAVKSAPDNAESYNLLCRAYFMVEDWDRGIPACERARNLDSKNSQYELWLGRIYGEKAGSTGFFSAAGLAKKVRTAFERAVQLDPKNWEARTDLAEFYLEAPGLVGGGKEKAQQQADALMPLNPAMSHWVAGRIAEKNKDAAAAEAEYRAAIAVSHGAVREWVDLAIFLRHANRIDEMEKALEHVDSAPVDRADSLMDAASLLMRTGRDPARAEHLLRLYLSAPVEQGPAFKAHDLLGQLLERQGDRKGAAEQFRSALALYHDYAHAKEDLQRIE